MLITALGACTSEDKGYQPPDIPHAPITIDASNESTVINSSVTSPSSASTNSTQAATQGQQNLGAQPAVPAALSMIDAQVVNSGRGECESGYFDATADTAVDPFDVGYLLLSDGDTLSIYYHDCVQTDFATGAQITKNGGISITLNTVASDLSVVFDGFTETSGDLSNTIHGDIRIVETNSSATISGESLYILSNDENIRLTKYLFKVETINGAEIVNLSYGLDSSLLGGHVDVKFIDLTTFSGDTYPSSGLMQIEGENMILTVNVLSNTQVSVERDFDKDGTADESVTVNWTDLNLNGAF